MRRPGLGKSTPYSETFQHQRCGRGPVDRVHNKSPKRCQYGHRWGILFRVGVRSLLASSESLDNVHETPDILDPPLSASSLLFLLLTSLDLGGLASDLKNVIFRIGSSNKEFQKRYAISGARPDRGQIVDHSPFQHEREIRGLFLP